MSYDYTLSGFSVVLRSFNKAWLNQFEYKSLENKCELV
ncbi:hypothetical protein ME7_01506 [Bartonella birtlesii LL-WM9]|uniref:Uncharacterized protein n=1 Tax=Bartonella birtlesii LL-WM9 TaxID=1094552 RepID=J1IT09_9HYPH|nr:hypothetical protein ME7_01506 [Bartonella birtlesii LL-WM9]